GRYVCFRAPNFAGATGDQVFLRDMQTGQIEQISLTNSGQQPDGSSGLGGEMSHDGRYVAFISSAHNLVTTLTVYPQVYLRDRILATTILISQNESGIAGNFYTEGEPRISSDGRHVLFSSRASNLVPGDTYDTQDLFVRDIDTNTT